MAGASERNQEKVRKLSRLHGNKECMNCTLKSTPYVVMRYGCFVCSHCSGLHRQFQHKVKAISMTYFKDKEVKELQEKGGNVGVAAKYRATWDPTKFPKPKPYDDFAIKKFIKQTFIKKIWYSEDGDLPEVQPIEKIIKEPVQLRIEREEPKKNGHQKQPSSSEGFGDDEEWDANFDETPVKQQPQQTTTEPSVDDFFGSPVTTEPTKTQTGNKKTIDVDALFGPTTTGGQQGGFNQGGFQQGGYGGQGGFNQQQGGFQQQQQGGYNQQQGGFNQGGFQQGGYGGQGGFNQGGFNQQQQGGYNQQGGFQQGGYGQQGGYNQQGGFQQGGFNQGGFNQQQMMQQQMMQQQMMQQQMYQQQMMQQKLQQNNPFGGMSQQNSGMQGNNPFGGQSTTQQQQPKKEAPKKDEFAGLLGSALGGLGSTSSSTNQSSSSSNDFPF